MISVIIPAYNEESHIRTTIDRVWKFDEMNLVKEIIIADGGSEDNTIEIAKTEGVKVISTPKGRAVQMNHGASCANQPLLYFLHADSIPPKNYSSGILKANQRGAVSGCFRLAFDHDHWFLKAHCWFTRFNINAIRFGDQSLFVTKNVFEKAGGFREDLLMMEDQEIIHRIRKHGRFKVMNDYVITSARKYVDNGIYRMQGIFYRIWAMYYFGYSQERLLEVHKKMIKNHKL
jgi:rSAM/selenodomain-associated transferase 2